MAEKFLMPKLSPTMEEGQIARWLKSEGETFESGETLAEVDTDKATMELTALKGGTLLKILKDGGETALLGETIAIVGNSGEDFAALLAEVAETPKAAEKSAPPVENKAEEIKQEEKKETAAPASEETRIIVSPIAARMATENGIDLRTISGSGPNGRIIKRDIESAINSPAESTSSAPSMQQSSVTGASPFHEEPTSKMRQVIAQRLGESIGPIPTFYLTVEIEMDKALEFRKQINASVKEEEERVSVNDVIVKVAAQALTKHPWVNSSYQDKTVKFYEDADIGVAVAIEDGLITPVIRGANRKGIVEISKEIKEKQFARERKLQPEEYTGATFSISNLGMFGIKEFTAIINPPEAGILAIGGAAPTAVVRDGEIVVRSIMHVTLSCDHRVVDGATGAKFLQTFKQMLENPILLLM